MSIVSLFEYEIGPILEAVAALDESEWHQEKWRQTMPFTPHGDTDSIFLRRQPGSRPHDVLYQLASVATRYYMVGAFSDAVHAICEAVEGRPARAMLARLRPGGVIKPHTDSGPYADSTERMHLPLITNRGAWLEVDGERYHLEAGVWHAIDKHVEHSGANGGDEPRLHLIVDVVPDSPQVFAG